MPVKKLPVGIEDFAKIRTEGFYYVDKSGLIKELLCNWGEVNLFTRPRRFGKSLNMSMLKCFFEVGGNGSLFDGLEISGAKELCGKYMGKFPVISLSLKDVNTATYEGAFTMLQQIVNREAGRMQYLLQSNELTEHDKSEFRSLLGKKMDEAGLCNSLLVLSDLLKKYYGQKVIILIDEYDVPLDKAFENGYYDEMVLLIRNMFSKALKSNESLYFAVLTGCLRVSKESIFTGLNNLNVFSITDKYFDEYFGFTDKEVCQLLSYYGLEACYEDIKDWYDGYRFGKNDVYCPWDVLNYCRALRADLNARPQSYWTNTSSNSIVKRFIQKAGKGTQREIEQLIAGEAIRKDICQELTYSDLDKTIDNLWSVLFTTGYLTQRGEQEGKQYFLAIPNLEVRDIFITQVKGWFRETALKESSRLSEFCAAFKAGKPDEVEAYFTSYLGKAISIRDTYVKKAKKENFYHGILLGLLSSEEDWIIMSNAESGEGYSDILIEIEDEGIGIVVEVKYADSDAALEAGCRQAVKQAQEKGYAGRLREDGMNKIFVYGIACCRKHCRVCFYGQ